MTIPLRSSLLTASVLLAACTADGAEVDWLQFRGPNAEGIVADAQIPTKVTDADYLWQVDMPGPGHGSPTFLNGRIYVTSETAGEKSRQVLCLDAADGRLVWAHKEAYEEVSGNHKFNSYAASTPAVDRNGVYVSWISADTFILFALDHEGKPLWRHEIPCGFATRFGPGASPIVLDGLVIMGNDHAGAECFLIGVDAATGRIAWKIPRKTGLASYCTPKVYRPAGGPLQVIFASTAHGVTGVDPASGEVLWEVPCNFTLKTCATPVISGGLVLATAGRGSGGAETATIALPGPASSEGPKIAYRSEARLPYVPTPIAHEGKFYLWTDAGFVSSVDAETGKELWTGRVNGKFFSSPLLIDGRIYNIDLDGRMTVVASDRFEILAEHQLPEGTHATPAVVGGRMYVRTYTRLICIGR